jgi:hypothetical protein
MNVRIETQGTVEMVQCIALADTYERLPDVHRGC